MIHAVWLGDAIRVANVVAALALAFASCWAMAIGTHWDQRVRFAIFGLFAVLLTSGHLANFGQDWSWRLPVLLPVIIAAVVSTVAFIRRVVEARRGPRGGWPRDL